MKPTQTTMEKKLKADALRRVVSRVEGLKYPHLVTSTNLRKQIATMLQCLNLQTAEKKLLCDFLGHDPPVHDDYYQLPITGEKNETVLKSATAC